MTRAHPLSGPHRAAALEIVHERFGPATTVLGEEPLGHEHAPVTRLRLQVGSTGETASVVVKTVRTDGDGHGGPPFLRREVVAHRLTGGCDVTVDLVGSALEEGVAVFGDAGGGPTVEQLLLGDDRDLARTAFVGIGEALGRLHAATAHDRDVHRSELVRHGASADDLSYRGHLAGPEGWRVLVKAARGLGVPTPAAAQDEVERLFADTSAGPYEALLHGDTNPGNCVVRADGVHLVDFESSLFGHVGFDLANLHFPFPFYSAHWATVPEEVAWQADAAYVQRLPEAWRDDIDRIRVEGAASALLRRAERLAVLADDDQPADQRWRRRAQLVQQLEVFVALGDGGHLPELTHWLRDLRDHLVSRWPDATDPPPRPFPAFGGLLRSTS